MSNRGASLSSSDVRLASAAACEAPGGAGGMGEVVCNRRRRKGWERATRRPPLVKAVRKPGLRGEASIRKII